MPNFISPKVLGQEFLVSSPEDDNIIIKIVNYDAPAVVRIVPMPGEKGETGQGLTGALSPIVYNLQTETISFDQTAQNATNDLRYLLKNEALDAGVIE